MFSRESGIASGFQIAGRIAFGRPRPDTAVELAWEALPFAPGATNFANAMYFTVRSVVRENANRKPPGSPRESRRWPQTSGRDLLYTLISFQIKRENVKLL